MLHLSGRAAARAQQAYGRVVWVSSNGLASPPPASDPGPSGSGGKKSKAKSRIFFALVGATAVTSATLALAKSNQDFRDILKDYAPWTDDAIAIVYGERETVVSKAISSTRDLATSASEMVFGSSTEPTPQKIEPPKPLTPAKKVEIITPLPVIPAPKPKELIVQKVAVKEEIALPKIEKFDSPEAAATMEAAGKAAVAAYRRAVEALNIYSKKIDAVMDDYSDEINKNILEDLKQSTRNLTEAEEVVDLANRKLEEALGGSDSSLAEKIRKHVKSAQEEHNRVSANTSVYRRYCSQVEQARKYFIEELQAIYPEMDIGAQKLDLRGGNPDALLLVVLRRILLYQQMLARQNTLLSQNIDAAMQGQEKDVIRAKVEFELEKERQKLSLGFQKKDAASRAKVHREMDTQLKKQLEIHTSHLQDALDARARQVTQEERKLADERAEQQRATHELRLAAVLGRLQGVDDALKARSDADKMARQSQKLWAACEALESALRRDTNLPMPLIRELEAIATAAADSDDLVVAVLRGVPNLARERGVFSELALRERFNKVEKACKKVALVPEEGGSLPVYFLSWLQSVFLIQGQGIPKDELDDQSVDFSKLDTHDILQRVRYWVERCDWTKALRYINLLKGAPSSVARDWTKEVTLHLEARQAARALLAHASATGLLHV
ncbi:inner membrane mitochondrial protein mitofilin [Arctopsyche grandis]|uniref:inner membrane mitochondrial protein mitofilin n=1 Tax=Arctopsyche grandis TaxID=121162 RepID=UPI00406D7F33